MPYVSWIGRVNITSSSQTLLNVGWLMIQRLVMHLHLNPLSDDVSSLIIRSCPDSLHHGESTMPTIDPRGLVGQEDGQCFPACIVVECIHFLCSAKDGEFEEILSYSGLMDSLESQEDGEENIWMFHWIMGHQGHLLHNDEDYSGSLYSVMIQPLSIIAKDDPMMCVKCLYGYLSKMKAGVICI
jgi:hypothetical protein